LSACNMHSVTHLSIGGTALAFGGGLFNIHCTFLTCGLQLSSGKCLLLCDELLLNQCKEIKLPSVGQCTMHPVLLLKRAPHHITALQSDAGSSIHAHRHCIRWHRKPTIVL
jgi:hypothetical protein